MGLKGVPGLNIYGRGGIAPKEDRGGGRQGGGGGGGRGGGGGGGGGGMADGPWAASSLGRAPIYCVLRSSGERARVLIECSLQPQILRSCS